MTQMSNQNWMLNLIFPLLISKMQNSNMKKSTKKNKKIMNNKKMMTW